MKKDSKSPETIRVLITHSEGFYKAREKYFVYKKLEGEYFQVVSEGLMINTKHAKQIPY